MRTAGKTAEFLKSLGYEVKEHLAITGVKGEMKRNGGPTLTVISELDAIGCILIRWLTDGQELLMPADTMHRWQR